ncbi:MFS transporter [Novosphingobium taihuense]|uniref:MFS family permease n=1 Tax=Novosphingobium taihuense TaxID=260085 RepID=A0A7W7A9R0_9SPHN|nr:MFS transporter [Novosphingobium taihuense]MBB4613060.1 MFS family permease [Novosphingobium taihuense]TWH85203.1 putative MFS family arabinose efflux permease [Novosphingobium taihuense]
MSQTPREVIEQTPMGVRQWIVVVLMVLLNALDGFDVLSSAFAAPGITADWGIARPALGVVLSAELLGMGFGSVLLGGAADRYGRKSTMLVCLVLMAIGMYLASIATAVQPMVAYRFLTGIGIGGMLTTTNAVVAESTNSRWRSVAIAVYVAGYPLGAIVGGIAASEWLLPTYSWHAVFLFGAVVTAVLIPVILVLVPETAAYLVTKRNLAGVNRTLAAFGKPAISDLPVIVAGAAKPRVTDILSNPRLRPVTLLTAFGYTFHCITFYYILKFGVQIVSDYPPGYPPAQAATVLTYANVGGFLGSALFGFVMARLGVRWPTALMLLIGAMMVAWFGTGRDTLNAWQWATMIAGFFTNAAISGYYAAFARGFPAYARATGTGFALGVGRLGAAGSPLLAGTLFGWLGDDQLLTVSIIMAMGSIVSLVLFLMLPERDGDDVMSEQPAA